MNRFFIEKINLADKFILLSDPAQLHHLRDVLRVKPKEKIAVFDREGNEYEAQSGRLLADVGKAASLARAAATPRPPRGVVRKGKTRIGRHSVSSLAVLPRAAAAPTAAAAAAAAARHIRLLAARRSGD